MQRKATGSNGKQRAATRSHGKRFSSQPQPQRNSQAGQGPAGPPDAGRTDDPDNLHLVNPSHSGSIAPAQLRTYARNVNASAIEIDFLVRGL